MNKNFMVIDKIYFYTRNPYKYDHYKIINSTKRK